MIVDKRQAQLLAHCIEQWQKEGHIDSHTADKLKDSYQVKDTKLTFDWKNLSLIAFFFSVLCILLATVMFLADKWLVAFVDALVDASDTLKTIFFSLLSGLLYYWAYRRKKNMPGRVYSNEALFILGSVSVAFALSYLSFALHMEEGDFPVFILLAAGIFGTVGIYLRSSLTWYLALGSLAVWFGTETAYRSGWESHFLGMNFPLRYLFFGCLLLLLSYAFNRFAYTGKFVRSTAMTGLLAVFISFWLLSIFGNYGDYDAWAAVAQYRFLYWAILLAGLSIGAIYYGLKKDDALVREVGIVFLLLDLYTRYFEFFWDSLHKVVFFIILAVSFWLIGKKAESIWHLSEKS